jgi:hypothetical protein
LIPDTKTQYKLLENGDFTIAGYNSSKPFSSFFPGIAGKNGLPMWTFYVNRGQCVCSMGVEGKHHPIMEFLPANWAYNLTPTQGFRTFVKLPGNASFPFYEPFQNKLRDIAQDRVQRMIISPAELRLEEENHSLGLKFTVQYFNIPEAGYAGLARKLSIENLNPDPLMIQVLDGLPLIIPYGLDDWGLKHLRRLFEAFVEVTNAEAGVPFFKLKVEPADRPDVVRITKGNFYLGMDLDGQLKPVIYDPVRIFGIRADYDFPEGFINGSLSELAEHQVYENRLPCAMGSFETTLAPHRTYTYISVIGHAGSVKVVQELVPNITQKGYLENKARVNREIISALTQQSFICSNEPVLDQYARQTFLDNVLRGGFPTTIGSDSPPAVLHLYSRKHGDLERDYNDYRLNPTPYSQGNGNFRDVNQNRRSDLFFNPRLKEGNLELFFSLIQLDGFNPLIIRETRFITQASPALDELLSTFMIKPILPSGQNPEYVEAALDNHSIESLSAWLANPWTPGELLLHLIDLDIPVPDDTDDLIGKLVSLSSKSFVTEHGEGYWVDHWTYNIDLLENYLAVFPERKAWILFQNDGFSFYDDAYVVLPREDKYVIWSGRAMQLGAVAKDPEKEALISSRPQHPHRVRTNHGKGEVYHCTLLEILLPLILNKLASLDPAGIGVEMEADKPGWYDALNGMPGLLGSSLNETLELQRHIQFLVKAIAELNDDPIISISSELVGFMDSLETLLASPLSTYEFWDRASTLKEAFRAETRLGLTGTQVSLPLSRISTFLAASQVKVAQAVARARIDHSEIPPTYFINEVLDYQLITTPGPDGSSQPKLNPRGFPCFLALKFAHKPLPLFLEGPVHYLRCGVGREEAVRLATAIRSGALFDQKLSMYKVNASLDGQPMEIGRARTFSPGWFENESIWLHMEYKYMLELLRNGLHEQFFHDFKNIFIPFLDPAVYGRSILENSSFISSSANPDPTVHGNGFVARLSGATAEFISILYLMALGRQPFISHPDGAISFTPKPALPAWLFTTSPQTHRFQTPQGWQERQFQPRTFSIMFLGQTIVTYYNPQLKDTFGPEAVQPVSWKIIDLQGSSLELHGPSLPDEFARKLRQNLYASLWIELR